MRYSKTNFGGRRPDRRGAIGGMPVVLILLATLSIAILGLATVSMAVAATPQPPMILPGSDASSSSATSGYGAGSQNWIVGGTPGVRTASIAASTGAKAVNARLGSYRVARDDAKKLAQRLQRAGRLVYAEPDVQLERSGYPLDLRIDEQWWLNRIVSPSDVTPPTVTESSPMIALVEESLDAKHPDLAKANLTGAKSASVTSDSHGTAVAAIAGSPGEMNGIRGVWPGARMRLFPSGTSCSTSSKAVVKAARQGAAVINMSYTFPANVCFTHFMATQFAVRSGSVPVASAGNSGATGNGAMRPAMDPHVLAVAAVDDASTVASFSTRNPGVDLAAPGQSVLAPVVTESEGSDGTSKRVYGWDNVSGTSFSAPMVSAAAAWMKQVRPQLGNLQVERLLTDSATDLGEPGRDPEYGAGLLSIESALIAPDPQSDPFEPNDDIAWVDGTYIKLKAPFLWKPGKGKRRAVTATLSKVKDPADVYKVKIPARRKVVLNAAQIEGDIALSAYKPATKSIFKPGKKNLIVRSNRAYPKTEGIMVRNLKKKPQTVWIAVTPASPETEATATYKLTVARR